MKDAEIMRALEVSICTVERTRCALAEHGLPIAVHGWPPQRKISRRKVDGWTEAPLIAASCAARRRAVPAGLLNSWAIMGWRLVWWTASAPRP